MRKRARIGTLILDEASERMAIRYGLEEYSAGIHCGQPLEVKIKNRWQWTRMEMSVEGKWYLVGINTNDIAGLVVRVEGEI